MQPVSVALTPGQVLASRWELAARLGEGGMGAVWRARDRVLGDEVALKVLHPDCVDAAKTDRFLREGRLARRVTHPGICRVFDLGEADGLRFLTMELVDGPTLRTLLAGEPPGAARALDLFVEVADAVAAAHAQGIVHRDLKPENVMVRPDGRAVVVDFGLARDPVEHGHSTAVAGTTAYMSPEQLRGERVGMSSDVFALGLLGYELLTGRSPFGGGAPAVIASGILRDDPAPLVVGDLAPEVAAALDGVLRRALAKSPDERFPTAAELRDAIVAARASLAVPAPSRRGRWIVAGLIVAASAAALVAAWPRAPRRPPQPAVTSAPPPVAVPVAAPPPPPPRVEVAPARPPPAPEPSPAPRRAHRRTTPALPSLDDAPPSGEGLD